MTDDEYPWEPPLAGSEVEHLVGALDRLRTTFRWKADDLDAAGLQASGGASSLTIGGLLKHLAAAEDYLFTAKLSGEPIGAPWDAMGWDGSSNCVMCALTNRSLDHRMPQPRVTASEVVVLVDTDLRRGSH